MNQDIGISGDVALLLERALPGFDARFWTRTDAYHQAYLSKEKAKGKLPELTAGRTASTRRPSGTMASPARTTIRPPQ